MKRFPVSFWVFLVGIAASVGQILMLGPLLSPRVASHFGFSGVADGYMGRETFLLLQWALTAFVAAVFIGIPAMIRMTPLDSLNVPAKEYWFAPERREATLSYFADRVYAFGAATLTLLVSTSQLVYEANLRDSPGIGAMAWVYLLFYLLYTAIWSSSLRNRFRLPSP